MSKRDDHKRIVEKAVKAANQAKKKGGK